MDEITKMARLFPFDHEETEAALRQVSELSQKLAGKFGHLKNEYSKVALRNAVDIGFADLDWERVKKRGLARLPDPDEDPQNDPRLTKLKSTG